MNAQKPSKKDFAMMATLSVICLGIACAAFFLNKKPEDTFAPSAAQEASPSNWSTDDTVIPSTSETSEPDTSTEETLTESEEIIPASEAVAEKETVSHPKTREEARKEAPAPSAPVTHYMENPESCTEEAQDQEATAAPAEASAQPPAEAAPPAPVPSEPEKQTPAADSPTEGKAYDPVFGWVDTTTPQQEITDNTGDIRKQVGTMN